jgi:uncharacterized C2H2 Zn-finger protein
MRIKRNALIIAVLILTVTTAAAPVSDIYAFVADAGEAEETTAEPYATEITPAPETMPAVDEFEGEGDYICFDCRMRFETEKEYVEHVKAEHPSKWEAMKSDYEGWFEEYNPETKSGFELNPYLKFALVASIFTTAWIIVHYVDPLQTSE